MIFFSSFTNFRNFTFI